MVVQVQQQRSGSPETQLAIEAEAVRPCFHHPVHRLQLISLVLMFGEKIKKRFMIEAVFHKLTREGGGGVMLVKFLLVYK